MNLLLDSWNVTALEGNPLGVGGLATEELVDGEGSLAGDGLGEEILLEGISLAGHLEGDGLDHGGVELVGAGDLNLRDVAGTLGDEGNTTLGISALVLGEEELPWLLIDHLEVTDVSVSLSGEVEHLSVLIVEGHQDTSGGVEVLLDQGVRHVGVVPNEHLTIGGLGETGGGEPLSVGEPDNAGSLHTLVSSDILFILNFVKKEKCFSLRIQVGKKGGVGEKMCYMDGLSGPDIEDANPLVPGSAGNECAVGVEGEGVDEIGVSEDLNLLLSLGDVPELDGQIGTSGGKGVVSNRVEGDLTDLAGVGSENGSGLSLTKSTKRNSTQFNHRRQ